MMAKAPFWKRIIFSIESTTTDTKRNSIIDNHTIITQVDRVLIPHPSANSISGPNGVDLSLFSPIQKKKYDLILPVLLSAQHRCCYILVEEILPNKEKYPRFSCYLWSESSVS